MCIPFLFELRTVLDWIFVKTSLTFFEWVRVESIYAQVYQIKSKRTRAYDENPRGVKMSNLKKSLMGGGITLLLIGVIWFPLILFALSPSLGDSNIPQEVTVNFQLGTYEPIYKAEAMQANIVRFNEWDWAKLNSLYDKNPAALNFLEEYQPNDVVALHFSTDSSTLWNVPPPNAEQMIADIESGDLKSCRFEYKISRNNLQKVGRQEIKGKTEYMLDDQQIQDDLIAMLKNPAEAQSVVIPSIFPKILLVRNKGTFENIEDLSQGKSYLRISKKFFY